MGCISSKPKSRIRASKRYSGPIVQAAEGELDRLADLPLHGKDDDYDLVSLVELSVRCNSLPKAGGMLNPQIVFYTQEQRLFIIRDK